MWCRIAVWDQGYVLASSIGHFEVVRNNGSKLEPQNSPRALSIQQKFRFEISEIRRAQWMVHSSCTDPNQATARLVLVLVSRIQERGSGNNNFVKWKGTFRSERPTDRNDQTCQSGSPSKLVPNISVGPNRNATFHWMYHR